MGCDVPTFYHDFVYGAGLLALRCCSSLQNDWVWLGKVKWWIVRLPVACDENGGIVYHAEKSLAAAPVGGRLTRDEVYAQLFFN